MIDYENAFDWKKPSVNIIGKWQPWHEGHTQLFKKALTYTGQVVIMVREVFKADGEDAPFGEINVVDSIHEALEKEGYYDGQHYVIVCVPNIVGFLNGPGNGVHGYWHIVPEGEEQIYSSDIREQLREEGKL